LSITDMTYHRTAQNISTKIIWH